MTLEEKIATGPLTSVVILSYNRLDDIRNNINSLYENTTSPFEVVILDNGSNKETIDYLRSIDGFVTKEGNGKIKVIYSPTNLGCSGGRREAVKHASGDYVYTVDNDMTYTSGWLDALITRIESDPKIGAVSSKIVFPNNKIQLNGGILELEDNYFGSFVEPDAGKYWTDQANLTGEIDCDWVCGGATLFRREVVDQVEHAEEYLNGFEDYDYAFQIAALGYRLTNCPDSVVFHHHIGFDEDKQKKEKEYLNDRWNPKRTWPSLVYFLERTGINTVKPSGFYDWLDQDGSKPFLKWGQVAGTAVEYEDLFPGRAFSELSNAQIKEQFDSIIAKNKEVRRQLGQESVSFRERDTPISQDSRRPEFYKIISDLQEELDQAGFTYNIHNLAGHLAWITRSDLGGKRKLDPMDIEHLVHEFRESTIPAQAYSAQQVYQSLRERLTTSFGE
jgi:GT2 family glycosyltransferase